MNFISGENFQSLTEISFYDILSDTVRNQINCKTQNVYSIESLSPESIKDYKKIFIYPDFIHQFMGKFLPFLKDATIVTHNSDIEINSEMLPYISSVNINKWFCQNKNLKHPKLFSLPIGIANSQWPHGNTNILNSIIPQTSIKNNLLYKIFNIGTNPHHRHQVDLETNKNGFFMAPQVTYQVYLEQIKQSYFCIAPLGNGADCHRIWECLYLNCVPIVPKRTPYFDEFEHLPIMFVDSYESITKDYLYTQIEKFYPFSKFNLDMLDLNYWKNKINNL